MLAVVSMILRTYNPFPAQARPGARHILFMTPVSFLVRSRPLHSFYRMCFMPF